MKISHLMIKECEEVINPHQVIYCFFICTEYAEYSYNLCYHYRKLKWEIPYYYHLGY